MQLINIWQFSVMSRRGARFEGYYKVKIPTDLLYYLCFGECFPPATKWPTVAMPETLPLVAEGQKAMFYCSNIARLMAKGGNEYMTFPQDGYAHQGEGEREREEEERKEVKDRQYKNNYQFSEFDKRKRDKLGVTSVASVYCTTRSLRS
ncbi:hypothetical protein C0J52_27224 [Blattella germanica]|nr:hypothetical protein C0J52_27224 [Blattella germanica]